MRRGSLAKGAVQALPPPWLSSGSFCFEEMRFKGQGSSEIEGRIKIIMKEEADV
jgi:hypothetical protein